MIVEHKASNVSLDIAEYGLSHTNPPIENISKYSFTEKGNEREGEIRQAEKKGKYFRDASTEARDELFKEM